MSPALRLSGAISGLLRRGSPVANQGGDERAVVVSVEDPVAMYVAIRTADPHPAKRIAWYGYTQRSWLLDLTDPTGRYHALLWLRERGHDLRWAEDEPEVLAWSVLSVSRGGGPIVGIVAQRCWGSAGCPPGTTRYYMEREGDRAQIFYADVTRKTDERDAKIAEALAARYAIRNPDGSLTLPELPKVSP